MQSYLLCASEIGSVKALLPICEALKLQNIEYFVIARGSFSSAKSDLKFISLNTEEDIRNFFKEKKITRYIFSSNIADTFPLMIARAAKDHGIRTIHILDFWSFYSHRMMLDGKAIFTPDTYVVPDSYAKKMAIKDGVDKQCIKVLGQPVFGTLYSKHFSQPENPRYIKRIIFILEPIEQDLKLARGYNEKTVIEELAECLTAMNIIDLKFDFLLHPRNDAMQIKNLLKKFPKKNLGELIQATFNPLAVLSFYPMICGMSSTLLYEAWLSGMQISSIQPRLKMKWLSFYKDLEGAIFWDKNLNENIIRMLESSSESFHNIQPNYNVLKNHSNSVKNILKI